MGKNIPTFRLVSAPQHDDPLAEAIRRLLHSSWSPIDFQYDYLTPEEQSCITRAQFTKLVPWVKEAPHG